MSKDSKHVYHKKNYNVGMFEKVWSLDVWGKKKVEVAKVWGKLLQYNTTSVSLTKISHLAIVCDRLLQYFTSSILLVISHLSIIYWWNAKYLFSFPKTSLCITNKLIRKLSKDMCQNYIGDPSTPPKSRCSNLKVITMIMINLLR